MDLDSRPFAPESLLQHDAFVRRLAKQLVRDEALALDLAQSTWVSLLSRPVAVASPRALLATIARRLAGKQRRSAMRRAARERLVDAPQPAPTPTELLAREEMRAQVVRAVLANVTLAAPSRIFWYSLRAASDASGAPQTDVSFGVSSFFVGVFFFGLSKLN